jgi:hypothetical protein
MALTMIAMGQPTKAALANAIQVLVKQLIVLILILAVSLGIMVFA